MIYNAVGGGTGSGLGCLMLERLGVLFVCWFAGLLVGLFCF
jgi:hypothetical protein